MGKQLWAAMAVVAVAVSVPAQAAPERRTLLVLEFASGAIDTEATRAASQLVAAALAEREQLEVASGEDLKQALALESEKAAIGCEDESCAAEIAGALGADLVVFGRGTRLGQLNVIHLTLFSANDARAIGRAQLTFSEPEQLLTAVRPAVAELTRDALGRDDALSAAALTTALSNVGSGDASAGLLWTGGAVVGAAGGAAVIVAIGALATAGVGTLTLQSAEATYRSPGASSDDKRAALNQAALARGAMGWTPVAVGAASMIGLSVAASGAALLLAGVAAGALSPVDEEAPEQVPSPVTQGAEL
jgi:hypothetical protein